jgi:hypothetical protein
MNKESVRAEKRKRQEKLDEVTEALETSEYSAVIAPFRDNEHFRYVGHALNQLRRIESQVISDLMEVNNGVEDDDIEECVVGHLLQLTEAIHRMIRILKVSHDLAWKALDEIDGVSSQESSLAPSPQ